MTHVGRAARAKLGREPEARYIQLVMLDAGDLPSDPEALRALIIAERARHAERIAEFVSESDRLRAIIRELQRHRFGRRSEQLDRDQLSLALEDVEQSLATVEAAQEGARRRGSFDPRPARSIAAPCPRTCRGSRR